MPEADSMKEMRERVLILETKYEERGKHIAARLDSIDSGIREIVGGRTATCQLHAAELNDLKKRLDGLPHDRQVALEPYRRDIDSLTVWIRALALVMAGNFGTLIYMILEHYMN